MTNEIEQIKDTIFYDPKESFLCVAGKKQLHSYLTKGKVGSGFAVLSDYALYCKGNYHVKQNQRHRYETKKTNYRIDLQEFQGMRYLNYKNHYLLGLAFFFLLLSPLILLLNQLTGFSEQIALSPVLDGILSLLLSAVCFLLYSIHSKRLLELIHTNGSLGLNLHAIPKNEERLLIRYLHAFLNSAKNDANP